MQAQGGIAARAFAKRLAAARRHFLEVVEFICINATTDPNTVYAGAVPYLMLGGTLAVGWQWGRALLAAERHLARGDDVEFMRAKVATASFYADHRLTRTHAVREALLVGSTGVARFPADAF